MSPFRNRIKTPEEIELEHKRTELDALQGDLDRREQAFNQLRTEIRVFEQVYEEILGARISALEDLEWQIKGLLDSEEIEPVPQAEQQEKEQHYSHFQHTTDLLDDDDVSPPDTSRLSLKSLYRGVAKAVHPDLASDDEDRRRRQELMAQANQAYQSGNRQVLADMLSDWEQGSEVLSGLDIAMELVRVIRLIARARQNILAVGRQIDELRDTDIYRFKQRVDEAMADGIDLLAEMAASVDQDIVRARKRLTALRGEDDTLDGQNGVQLETRLVRFPADVSCGTLYVRSSASVDYRDWQRVGAARGIKEFALDRAVRLDVKGSTSVELGFLEELQPDDLQALFLYDIDDSALARIRHLTGLREVYLSNTTVSDQGLTMLRSLQGLQRISIYHSAISDSGLLNLVAIPGLKWLTCSGTAISEEGLQRFRLAMPGCKAVSFKWRYDG